MLSNMSDLFKNIENGDEKLAAVLIDTLGVDLATRMDESGGHRSFLDAALRSPSRAIFDRAEAAYAQHTYWKTSEGLAQDWERWLRDASFSVSMYKDSNVNHGALTSAMRGMRPWSVEEIFERHTTLDAHPDKPSWHVPLDRSPDNILNLLMTQGIQHSSSFRDDWINDLFTVIQGLQKRFEWTPEQWLVPVGEHDNRPAALAFVACSKNAEMVDWFIDHVGLPLTLDVEGHAGWASALTRQRGFDGLQWLLRKDMDWNAAYSRVENPYEASSSSFKDWIHQQVSILEHGLGERPTHKQEAMDDWENKSHRLRCFQSLILANTAHEQGVDPSTAPRPRTRL